MAQNPNDPQWAFRMSSKELVLISKALRGIYSEKDIPLMLALAERMLKGGPGSENETKAK